jgi:Ca-activated chloride channel family protein
METNYALSQTILPIESPSTFDLLLTFRSETSHAPRPPRRSLNLSLVIDRSGSMAGKPLQQALRAAEALADQLNADDVLSIVVYDDKVDTLLPPQKVTDKAAIRSLLHKVRAGGTTNLSGGWLRGCEHVQATADPEMIRRVLLLSDGQANVGVTDSALLIRTARQKADAGIVTTTLGFGANFNEDLMIGMAQAAGGNFYFIQSPDDAADVFRIEVESLSAVVAQNLTVTLTPRPGVQVAHVLSSGRVDDKEGTLTLTLGDVYDNEDKRLALEIALEPQVSTGVFDLLLASYTYQAVADDAIQEFTGTVPVSVPLGTVEEAMAAAPATDVVEQISRLRIARAKDEAIAQADGGDVAGAVQTLRRVLADLQAKGLHERFEIAEEMDQLEHFAQRIESRQFDTQSRKEMRDQSFQARTRGGRADLSLRGVGSGTARDLPTTQTADGGVELECFREGGKLRIRVLSGGYDPSFNVQFPRAVREEGVHYVVDSLDLSADGTFYRAAGTIRRLVLPGQENRYASTGTRAGRTAPPQAAKVSARTAADLETTDTVGTCVIVQCIKEGSKLRARVVSDGYDPAFNMRFPRDIREEGILYVVDEVIEPAGGGQYIACGKIRRLVQ